jgi:hypothetical protein
VGGFSCFLSEGLLDEFTLAAQALRGSRPVAAAVLRRGAPGLFEARNYRTEICNYSVVALARLASPPDRVIFGHQRPGTLLTLRKQLKDPL